jgi:mono/diheme cytochrome c family protein
MVAQVAVLAAAPVVVQPVVVQPGVALNPAPPREADGTIAEGYGDRGGARDVCVSCHQRSGANDAGPVGYGDFVFTRVAAP